MKKREKIMEYVFLLAAVISIVAVALICVFLLVAMYVITLVVCRSVY